MKYLINVVAFQVAWFACVLGAAHGRPWLGTAIALAAVVLHLSLAEKRQIEAKLIAASGLIGFAGESSLIVAGYADFKSPGPIAGLPPVWLIAMWFAFATLLNVSLSWVRRSLLLASILGFALGPLAYYAGTKLGGMTLSEPLWRSLGATAVMWAIAMPLLVWLARRWDRDG